MRSKFVVTHDRVVELLTYDPGTGEFRWKVKRGPMTCDGCIAGCISDSGYRKITIDGRSYLASRLAWLIVKGHWPPDDIDHYDLDRSNDRIDNLRPATRQQNCANRKAHSNNLTGLKGVSRHKGGYTADIMVDGKRHYLGSFPTAAEAHTRYCQEAQKHFGEFARCA